MPGIDDFVGSPEYARLALLERDYHNAPDAEDDDEGDYERECWAKKEFWQILNAPIRERSYGVERIVENAVGDFDADALYAHECGPSLICLLLDDVAAGSRYAKMLLEKACDEYAARAVRRYYLDRG